MNTSRRWYERTLGVALVLVGLLCTLPLLFVWVWAHHQYTVGLSMNWRVLPVFGTAIIGLGVLAVLGGIALLRRP